VNFQIFWSLWNRASLEVVWRTDNRQSQVGAYPHGDHVALDQFANVNPSIKVAGHEINGFVGSGDVKNDIGKRICELPQLRQQHHSNGRTRQDEPQSACRSMAQLAYLRQRSTDSFESWSQVVKKRVACRRRRDMSCRARKQLHP
jgi:hypothetical protein